MTGTSRALLFAIPCLAALSWGSQWLGAQQPVTLPPAQAGLVTHVIEQEGRPHTVVVADVNRAVVAVYHIDPLNGKLSLKSVRNVSWDLQMLQFNSESPLPEEVRSGLER